MSLRLHFPCLLIPGLIVSFFLASPLPATAQVRTVTLDEVRQELKPGDQISVVRTAGESMKGKLTQMGTTDFDLQVLNAEEDHLYRIPFDAVRSLERLNDPTKNGVLLGAGIGVGVGVTAFAIAMMKDANESDEWAAGYIAFGAVSTGIGAVAGWLVDALHSKPRIRYESSAAADRLKIRAMPFVGRHERGVTVSFSF